MSQFRIELNHAGIEELLKSPEMQSLLKSQASRIADSASDVEVYVAGTRAVAEARGKNKDNSLLKRL